MRFPRFFLSRCPVLLLALACLLLAPVLASATAENEESRRQMETIMNSVQKQVQQASKRFEKNSASFNRILTEYWTGFPKIRNGKDRLMLMQALSYEPWDYIDLLEGADQLLDHLDALLNKPGEMESLLHAAQTNLEAIESEIRIQIGDAGTPEEETAASAEKRRASEMTFQGDAEMQFIFAGFIAELRELTVKITGRMNSLHTALQPAKQLKEDLSTMREGLKDKLSNSWNSYYTTPTPSILSLELPTMVAQAWEEWLSDIDFFKDMLSAQNTGRSVLEELAKGAVLAVACLLAGLIGLRLFRERLSRYGPLPQLVGAWVMTSVAICFVYASTHCVFFVHSQLLSLGEMSFSAALVFFSRYLRAGQERRAGNLRAPLWPLWGLYSLGFILCTWIVPSLYIEPALALAQLLAAFWLFRQFRTMPADEKLDRLLARLLAFILPPLALLALFGYPQLSALLTSVLFYILLALRYSISIMRFLGRWEASISASGAPVFISIFSAISFPLIFAILLFLLLWLLSSQFGGEYIFMDVLNREYQFQAFAISVRRLALIVLGFYVTKAAIALSGAFIRDVNERSPVLDPGAAASLLTITRYLWWGIYFLAVLFLLGVSLTSLAVVAGGLSVGIGFGLQNIVNNFVSGLILLFGRSVQAGDSIQLGDMLGVVKEVTIRNTKIETLDNATIFVPNSALISNQIINWSHQDPKVRRELVVGVAYGSDLELVRALLLQAAAECPRVLREPKPGVLLNNFGASSLDHTLRVWIVDVTDTSSILSDVRNAIDRLFRAHGIEISFPQSDVHLRSAPALEALGLSGKTSDAR